MFDVTDPAKVDEGLKGIQVLVNGAGPFMHTAESLIRAAIRNKVHYLDTAAELDSYKLAEKFDEEAKQAGVMLILGAGGSVSMLSCLASRGVARVKEPVTLEIALRIAGSMSRGSAISAAENLTTETLQRVNGKLVPELPTNTTKFDFDNGVGSVDYFPVTLPDLLTIYRATKIPNIRTYAHAAGNAFPTGDLSKLPDGPTPEQREASPYDSAVRVTGADGTVKTTVLHTVNGYTFTPVASVEAAKRVLAGAVKPGWATPAEVLGDNFGVEILPGKIIAL